MSLPHLGSPPAILAGLVMKHIKVELFEFDAVAFQEEIVKELLRLEYLISCPVCLGAKLPKQPCPWTIQHYPFTVEEAEERGWSVDRKSYPWVAFKGDITVPLETPSYTP